MWTNVGRKATGNVRWHLRLRTVIRNSTLRTNDEQMRPFRMTHLLISSFLFILHYIRYLVIAWDCFGSHSQLNGLSAAVGRIHRNWKHQRWRGKLQSFLHLLLPCLFDRPSFIARMSTTISLDAWASATCLRVCSDPHSWKKAPKDGNRHLPPTCLWTLTFVGQSYQAAARTNQRCKFTADEVIIPRFKATYTCYWSSFSRHMSFCFNFCYV